MGNCTSASEDTQANNATVPSRGFPEDEMMERRSKALDKELRDYQRRMERQLKILLLGAGESGKTTVLKQMKVLHAVGFTPQELDHYRRQVFQNLWDGMRACLEAMQVFGLRLGSDASRDVLYLFEEQPMISERGEFPSEYEEPLQQLWQDSGVQAVLKRATEASLPDSIVYFFSEIDRFFEKGYEPTYDDIFRVRGKTTGITETIFMHKSLTYRMFDVGGQRSERRKWIHCFENVTAVLFLAAMSGYDQGLIEDRDSNQMQEALMLFDSICNSTWFVRTSMILFLNKIDIFREKILISPISAHFPDYKGSDTDYNASRQYFKDRFLKLNRTPKKEVYASYTTAIDTTLLRVVMVSVQDTIINRNLESISF